MYVSKDSKLFYYKPQLSDFTSSIKHFEFGILQYLSHYFSVAYMRFQVYIGFSDGFGYHSFLNSSVYYFNGLYRLLKLKLYPETFNLPGLLDELSRLDNTMCLSNTR